MHQHVAVTSCFIFAEFNCEASCVCRRSSTHCAAPIISKVGVQFSHGLDVCSEVNEMNRALGHFCAHIG